MKRLRSKGAICIKKANWGIAYRFNNVIEINPVLRSYPNLYKKILKHEMEHGSDTKIDFFHDLKSLIKFFDLESLRFVFKHPIITLQSVMPVWYDRGWNYNLFAVIMWLVVVLVILFVIKRGAMGTLL